MNDNNNNLMEINTEESKKKKEKKEKIDNLIKKIKGLKDKLKEDKEDKKRAKEELERVAAEEKKETKSSVTAEKTITNTTIKNTTPTLSAQEERRKKAKRKKFIRNIMTIPEIIIVIIIALFLKNRYVDYSKNAHQVLNYKTSAYVYEIHRDVDLIKVVKSKPTVCPAEPCELEKIGEYNIKFEKKKMTLLKTFIDLQFKFSNKTTIKDITIDSLKTDFSKKCLYSLIHNNEKFLSYESYGKYNVSDYEQMGTITSKGYKFEDQNGLYKLSISAGEKQTSGYGLVVNTVYKDGDEIYVFIKEQVPQAGETVMNIVTHPLVVVELEEKPKSVHVYDIESGEEYVNLDAPKVPELTVPQERRLTPIWDYASLFKEEMNKKANN